jgi:hypothetical protein
MIEGMSRHMLLHSLGHYKELLIENSTFFSMVMLMGRSKRKACVAFSRETL